MLNTVSFSACIIEKLGVAWNEVVSSKRYFNNDVFLFFYCDNRKLQQWLWKAQSIHASAVVARTYFAKAIEYVVEEDKYRPSGYLGDVVEGLTGVVAHTSVGVFKTSQNRLDQFGQVHTDRCLVCVCV